MKIQWNAEKNIVLKKQKIISFEEIEGYIANKQYIDIIRNVNYKNQLMFLVNIKNYIYCVPFVFDEKGDKIFLKTIYPSRIYTKQYLGGDKK